MIIIDFFKAIFTDIMGFFSKPLNFGGPLTAGKLIIWAIIIGFMIAAFVCLYNKVFLGKFVSFLLKNKADTEETAKTLKDAGISNAFVKRALKSETLYSKLVCTNETDKKDILNVRFFIPSEKRDRADRLYAHNGISTTILIISLFLLVLLAAIAYIALPELIQMTKNFSNMIK